MIRMYINLALLTLGLAIFSPYTFTMENNQVQCTASDFTTIQDECPICMESFDATSLITKCSSPCTCKGIAYHPTCIQSAIAQNNSCPVCRAEPVIANKPLAFQAILDARKPVVVAQPATPTPAPILPATQSRPLVTQDFEGIEAHCSLCAERFEATDYVTKCSCSCKHAYHYHCLINYVENSDARSCPQCKSEIASIPNGIPFTTIRRAPQVVAPKPEAPVHPQINPVIIPVQPEPVKSKPAPLFKPAEQQPAPAAVVPDKKDNEQPKKASVPFISNPLLLEALLAVFYGAVAEHIYSSDITQKQKFTRLGCLGLTLLPIHYTLHKEQPQPALKRALTWLAGSLVGFATPFYVKKAQK